MPEAPSPVQPAPPAQDLSDATAAAAARLEGEFGNNAVDGFVPPANAANQTPAAAPHEAAEGGELDIFDDAALDSLNFDGLQYRDGMTLRSEIQKSRDRFKPFNDAFGSMDDDQRQLLLDSAPTL